MLFAKKSQARPNKFAAQDLREEAKEQRQAANIAAHNKIYKQLENGKFVKRKKKMPAGLAAGRKRVKRKAAKNAAKLQATARKSNRLKATTTAAGGGKDTFFGK